MKAFIFDPLWNELVDKEIVDKLNAANVEVVVITDVKPLTETTALFEGDEERLLCLNPDYVKWKLTNEDYENIPNLKGIMIASTAFEWVEKTSADKLGIPICHIVNFSTQAVAEWAVMMMFALARQTPRLIKDGFPLDYDKDYMKYRGVQLKGKTAGIIGLGNNGLAIAERCKGLGMNVVYWSRSSVNNDYEKVTIEALLSDADVIFPAFAKNAETAQLMTQELIDTAKKSAMFIDIVGLGDEAIMAKKVENGDLYGYGFESKPGEFTTYAGNVWAAPAYAWATYESMYNSETQLVDNIVSATQGQFPFRIN